MADYEATKNDLRKLQAEYLGKQQDFCKGIGVGIMLAIALIEHADG